MEKESKLDFKYNLKVYLSFLKKHTWLLAILIFVVLVNEAKSIFDKFVLKIAIDNATSFLAGSIVKTALISSLLFLAIILFITTFISFGTNWFKIHLLNRLDAKMIIDLKERYFSHLISLDHKFYTSNKTGSLISRLVRGGSAMERLNDSIAYNFSPLILQFSVLVLSFIYLDFNSAVILIITVAVFLTYSLSLQKRINRLNVEMNNAEDIEKANVSDVFTNIDSIKYFGKEKAIQQRYMNLAEKTKEKQMIAWDAWRILSAGQSFILGIGTILILFFSFKQFLAGTMSLGTLAFIYTTYFSILTPLFGFVHGVRDLTRSLADFNDLFEYGKIESNIKDKSNAKEIKIEKGEIEFRNVSFAYERGKVFENFNLKIPANKKIALVGHSGCGKTSLIKLLYRLYDVKSGQILIDRQDIRNVKHESLRSEMAIVPQECVLFDDTIYNNIQFSNPKATKEQVMKAIKFAQLDRVIARLPNKENTVVGERGIKLSGGEKQRVSIARAILANKKILVLDEATSSLDSETESEIQKDLEKLMQDRTSIVIAHRLSTIMRADTIVVMKEGKIVQMGNHKDLINQSGEYKKLWNLQKGGYIKE